MLLGRTKRERRRQRARDLTDLTNALESVQVSLTAVSSRLDDVSAVTDARSAVDAQPAADARPRWGVIIGIATSVVSVVIASLALVLTQQQNRVTQEQLLTAQQQLAANQRVADWRVVGNISVDVDAEHFVLDNRSDYSLMTTGTWLVGDTAGWERFDAVSFELTGVPSCSRVRVPIAEVTRHVDDVPGLSWASAGEDWPAFTSAYTYLNAPSGGWYSTSSGGGVVDHSQVELASPASVDYGERDGLPLWQDLDSLVWIPDTFWEFGHVQIGAAAAPLHAGLPVIGKDDGIEIEEIACTS